MPEDWLNSLPTLSAGLADNIPFAMDGAFELELERVDDTLDN